MDGGVVIRIYWVAPADYHVRRCKFCPRILRILTAYTCALQNMLSPRIGRERNAFEFLHFNEIIAEGNGGYKGVCAFIYVFIGVSMNKGRKKTVVFPPFE